jgi:hypothetical protein
MGRPTKYSDKTAERICERLMRAESLRRICKSPDMPSITTVCNWLATDHHPFLAQYERARRIQAEMLADELIEIADDATNGGKDVSCTSIHQQTRTGAGPAE